VGRTEEEEREIMSPRAKRTIMSLKSKGVKFCITPGKKNSDDFCTPANLKPLEGAPSLVKRMNSLMYASKEEIECGPILKDNDMHVISEMSSINDKSMSVSADELKLEADSWSSSSSCSSLNKGQIFDTPPVMQLRTVPNPTNILL
jgi:hypothetical protein